MTTTYGSSSRGLTAGSRFPAFAGNDDRRLRKRKIAVKQFIMDGHTVAGIGNIYADEMLFDARIHPEKAASSLRADAIERLYGSMKKVLTRAIEANGSTLQDYRDADGNEGGFQEFHRVYGQAGEPCFACGTPIRMRRIGGRSSHFCPRCQRRRARRAPN